MCHTYFLLLGVYVYMKLEELISLVKKEDIIKLYITENNTRQETADKLNIKTYHLDKLCKYYDIVKPKELTNKRIRESQNKNKDEVVAKIKQTKLERYGDENYNNTRQSKKTRLKKYGEYHNNTEKAKETCLKKYGVPYNPGQPEKAKKTKLERYGDENYNNAKQQQITIKQKHEDLDAYYKEVSDKAKQTRLEKYGNENYTNFEKYKQTCIEKYGVDNVSKSKEVIDKIKQTKQERYGKPSYNNIEQIRQTCKEKYGYDYACMRPEARCAGSNNSGPNLYFMNLLEDNNIEFEREFSIDNRSYDFKIGDTLIEIDPSATHNSTWGIHGKPKDKYYHIDKTLLAEKHGYRCIHVWDWDNYESIINLLKSRERVYARKCIIKEVSKQDAATFINTYHLQGYIHDSIRIGLHFNDELISIMTFGKPRYNKNVDYELLRYCNSCNVIGGAEKIFTYFIRKYNPKKVISYCDKSKFNGNTYTKLGFKYIRKSIGKHWYNIKTQRHITNNLLLQKGFDSLFNTNYGKEYSNESLMLQHNFVEVYDCGQITYIYEND